MKPSPLLDVFLKAVLADLEVDLEYNPFLPQAKSAALLWCMMDE